MKVKVEIITRQTTVLDIGDIPPRLIQELLEKNNGTFDGNWTVGDCHPQSDEYETEVIAVTETK